MACLQQPPRAARLAPAAAAAPPAAAAAAPLGLSGSSRRGTSSRRRGPRPTCSLTSGSGSNGGSSGSLQSGWLADALGLGGWLGRPGGGAAGAGAPALEGVVIVDHGSRKKESNEMLHEFGELYKRTSGRALVEVAHMELAEPTIEQAVGRCAAAGARRVVIAPYFLSRGRHVQQDIPALAAAAAAAYPEVECVVAEPIGLDGLMARLIENRVAAAAAGGAPVVPAPPQAEAAGGGSGGGSSSDSA